MAHQVLKGFQVQREILETTVRRGLQVLKDHMVLQVKKEVKECWETWAHPDQWVSEEAVDNLG